MSPISLFRTALPLLACFVLQPLTASAQTQTDCQPLNTTNCPPDPAFATDFNFNFNSTPDDSIWETQVGPIHWTDHGAKFTINDSGDSPTLRSKFYIFWGRVEVIMKAATGTGIISSVMLLSDDLDEIDWEFMGGNATHGESNYFGKGRTEDPAPRAIYHPIEGGAQGDYHNYTTIWKEDSLEFYIDGQHVRTQLPKDANNTNNYPQTPMRISFGIWAGGDVKKMPKGTREWAGGDTDFSKAPFDMYVKSARVTDFSKGKEYSYGDQSGSFKSIRIAEGNSTASETVNEPPTPSMSERWESLSPTARIAIIACSAGAAVLLFAWGLFYFIRQRRRGVREARAAEARYNQEQMELSQMRAKGIDPDSFVFDSPEYNSRTKREDTFSVGGSPSPVSSPSEKPWQAAGLGAAAAAAAAGGMRSPGPHSPQVHSPGPMSPGSPAHTPSQEMPPRFPSPASPAQRSATMPHPTMRMGSPGPQAGGYGDMNRTNSPGPVAPQRSLTSNSLGHGRAGYGPNQGYGSPGGGGGGYGGNTGNGYM